LAGHCVHVQLEKPYCIQPTFPYLSICMSIYSRAVVLPSQFFNCIAVAWRVSRVSPSDPNATPRTRASNTNPYKDFTKLAALQSGRLVLLGPTTICHGPPDAMLCAVQRPPLHDADFSNCQWKSNSASPNRFESLRVNSDLLLLCAILFRFLAFCHFHVIHVTISHFPLYRPRVSHHLPHYLSLKYSPSSLSIKTILFLANTSFGSQSWLSEISWQLLPYVILLYPPSNPNSSSINQPQLYPKSTRNVKTASNLPHRPRIELPTPPEPVKLCQGSTSQSACID